LFQLLDEKEVWERLKFFLNELLPIAEENNVSLAAHPNDPPLTYYEENRKNFKKPK
jgi:mannonate dehydratase